MTDSFIIEILLLCVRTIVMLIGPLILAVVVVAILSNVVQTVTQIKDPALAFVPKITASIIVLVLGAPWFLQVLESFGRSMFKLLGRGPM